MAEITLEQIEKARAAMFAPLKERKAVDWDRRPYVILVKTPRQVWQETTGIKLK